MNDTEMRTGHCELCTRSFPDFACRTMQCQCNGSFVVWVEPHVPPTSLWNAPPGGWTFPKRELADPSVTSEEIQDAIQNEREGDDPLSRQPPEWEIAVVHGPFKPNVELIKKSFDRLEAAVVVPNPPPPTPEESAEIMSRTKAILAKVKADRAAAQPPPMPFRPYWRSGPRLPTGRFR